MLYEIFFIIDVTSLRILEIYQLISTLRLSDAIHAFSLDWTNNSCDNNNTYIT